MPPRSPSKRATRPPSPPPAARARRGEGRDAGATAASTSSPAHLINPTTGAPFLGVAAVPPTTPADPPRFHGWAIPREGRRVSVGKGHATAEGAARARDRAAIALKGRAAFESTGGGRAGRAPGLNYPLASYPAAEDFGRTGEELKAFLKGLAKSGDVSLAPRVRLGARAPRCGACDACRRPWLKRPCAGKEKAGGKRVWRAATVPAAPAVLHAPANTQRLTDEAAAALVGAAAAATRAARLAPGATLDPWTTGVGVEDPYGQATLEAWVAHDYGADLKAVVDAEATGRPVMVPRPGAHGLRKERAGV